MLKAADRAVVDRYARALFDAAQSGKAVDAVRADLARWLEVAAAVPEWAAALQHPRVAPAVKGELLARALGKPSALTGRLLDLLMEKKRLDALADIARRFNALADESRGVVAVSVGTAQPLSAEQTAAMKKSLSKIFGEVALHPRTDPALLGGLVVQVGDRLWDGSVAAQLARLKDAWLSSATN